MNDKKVETEYVYLKLTNGIVHVIFKSNLNIKLDIAQKIVNSRLELIDGKSYPTLVDGRNVISMDKETRDCFVSEKGREGVKAAAVLTGSVFNRFLSNFFLKVSFVKSYFPTRLFTDEAKAIEWLEQFK